MQLDAEYILSADVADRLQHILPAFPRQAQDQVHYGFNMKGGKLVHRLVKDRKRIASVDELGGFLVNSLQAQLDPKEGLLIQFGQQFQDSLRQTVGPCGDGDTDDAGIFQRLVIFLPEHFYGSVGIGMALEINNILSRRPFFRKQPDLSRNITGKIAGAFCGTENTPAGSLGTVSVGTGKACVQRQLDHLAAEAFF